jgi:hypothetical protein
MKLSDGLSNAKEIIANITATLIFDKSNHMGEFFKCCVRGSTGEIP